MYFVCIKIDRPTDQTEWSLDLKDLNMINQLCILNSSEKITFPLTVSNRCSADKSNCRER